MKTKMAFFFIIGTVFLSFQLTSCQTTTKDGKTFDEHSLDGTLSMAQGDYSKAVASYEKALQINSNPDDNAVVYRGLANSYYHLEEYKKAIDYLKKAIEKNPNDELSYALSGSIYYKLKDHKQCIKVLEKYISLEPEDIDSYVMLSNAYFETKEYAKAIQRTKTYLQKKPNDADMHLLLGMCYVANNGSIDDIVKAFSRAAELGSDKALKFLHMIAADAAQQSQR